MGVFLAGIVVSIGRNSCPVRIYLPESELVAHIYLGSTKLYANSSNMNEIAPGYVFFKVKTETL
jgi:hypothetical protein